MRENKSENLSEAAQEFITQELRIVDKYSSGQVDEPVAAPEVARRGTRVETLLWEAEARGRARLPTMFQRARVQVSSISFTEASSHNIAIISTDIQQTEA